MGVILEARVSSVEVDDSLRLETTPGGRRRIFRGRAVIADDDDGMRARCAGFVLEIRAMRPVPVSVAVLGGGLGLIPALLGPDFDIRVYEIEPALSAFCPPWATFIPGDWRTTYDRRSNVVILDTGETLTDEDEALLKPAVVLR